MSAGNSDQKVYVYVDFSSLTFTCLDDYYSCRCQVDLDSHRSNAKSKCHCGLPPPHTQPWQPMSTSWRVNVDSLNQGGGVQTNKKPTPTLNKNGAKIHSLKWREMVIMDEDWQRSPQGPFQRTIKTPTKVGQMCVVVNSEVSKGGSKVAPKWVREAHYWPPFLTHLGISTKPTVDPLLSALGKRGCTQNGVGRI